MVRYSILFFFLFLSGCIGKTIKVMHHQGSLFTNTADFLRSHTEIQARQMFPLSDEVKHWKLLQRVLKNLGKDSKEYSAVVVESPMINAFASPNKRFYVTTGLLRMASTEDEIAAVVAHELSHIELKHYESHIDDFRALRIFDVLNVYSKEMEYEADKNAIQVMKKSAYQSRAMIDFFKKMNAAEERSGAKLSHWFASHPATEDRIRKFEVALNAQKIAQPQKPIQSSAEFYEMKDKLRAEQSNYQPKGLYSYEPPRLQVNKEFDQIYARLHALIVRNQDLDFARDELLRLREQNSKNDQVQAAIALLIAKMAYYMGDYETVQAESEFAKQKYPTFTASLWWPIKIKIAKDQSSSAYAELKKLMETDACRKNTECLREGAEISYEYFFDEEDSYEPIQEFIAALTREQNEQERKAAEETASTVAVRQVYQNLEDGEGEPKRYLPQGVQPSPILQDWIEYEKFTYQNYGGRNNPHKGFYLGVALLLTSNLRSELSTKYGYSIDLGYRNRLWEEGLFFSSLDHVPIQSSYVASYSINSFRLSHTGLYLGYHFANRLKYPFIKLKAFTSTVSYNDYSTKVNFNITQGSGYAFEFGYNFPGSGGALYGTWYRIGLEYIKTNLNPYWGTDGNNSYIGVNLELRLTSAYKTGADEDVFQRPPVFY